MKKVYQLKSDFEHYAHFVERGEHIDKKFIKTHWKWKQIDLEKYQPIVFDLHASDNRHKNYKMDISASTGSGLIVFSEKAINALRDVLEPSGQIVPIITSSKAKKFFGFYPNKHVYGDTVIDLEHSDFQQYEKGKVFNSVVLRDNYPQSDYLFTLSSIGNMVFATEDFKQLVEQHDLKGFDFSKRREIKITPNSEEA